MTEIGLSNNNLWIIPLNKGFNHSNKGYNIIFTKLYGSDVVKLSILLS